MAEEVKNTWIPISEKIILDPPDKTSFPGVEIHSVQYIKIQFGGTPVNRAGSDRAKIYDQINAFKPKKRWAK